MALNIRDFRLAAVPERTTQITLTSQQLALLDMRNGHAARLYRYAGRGAATSSIDMTLALVALLTGLTSQSPVTRKCVQLSAIRTHIRVK